MNDIALRVGITLLLVVVGVLAYTAFSRFSVRRAEGRQLGLESAKPGVPTVLYFTTPYCAPCRTIQAPALDKLAATYGDDLQVIKIDADEQPEVAKHWGVMTVPTTYVIDRKGKPKFFNPGIAKADKLEKQLVAAGMARH
jgi:thioredoxin 1